MAELRPIPLPELLRRVLDEPARTQSLFDLPLRKCWRPSGRVDLGVDVHGHRAQTPVGPAAGPHAQLAQNIVLAWLGGSRVIELKTVQIKDELRIPRPCIDAATVGFNVEWSQELRLGDSLREYVAGWMLIRMLRALDPIGLGAAADASEPIFELSVGYDLEGLRQPAMRDYLRAVRDVGPIIDSLRDELRAAVLPDRARALIDLDFRRDLVSCVTLSTFHGCPPGEIEAIGRYLLEEHDFDVIVKMNPTLLGYEEVRHLLHDRMGYHELRPRQSAFDGDLRWDEAIALGRRLDKIAERRGRHFGVKMTNTLVVDNHKKYFTDELMYLSGPPLHVLAMHCVDRFRAAFGPSIPLSFSGGIDAHNFADAVACDLVPVTTCTDLLRAGGYGRLPRYLENLEAVMLERGARDRDELILRRFDKGAEAARQAMAAVREEAERLPSEPGARAAAEAMLAELEVELVEAARTPGRSLGEAVFGFVHKLDIKILEVKGMEARAAESVRAIAGELPARIVREAGVLNSHEVALRVTGDPRYAAGKNAKPPRKVGSSLVLLDCLSCDKCVPVCPNDANFSVETPPEDVACEDVVLAGGTAMRVPAAPFRVTRPQQWANYADACNECGNCDVFCPEDGGPYIVKARFFGSRESFEASPALDGFFVEASDAGALRVSARLDRRQYVLDVPASGPAVLGDGVLRARYDVATAALLSVEIDSADVGESLGAGGLSHKLRGAVFPTLRALVRGALSPAAINPVSARLPELRWPG